MTFGIAGGALLAAGLTGALALGYGLAAVLLVPTWASFAAVATLAGVVGLSTLVYCKRRLSRLELTRKAEPVRDVAPRTTGNGRWTSDRTRFAQA